MSPTRPLRRLCGRSPAPSAESVALVRDCAALIRADPIPGSDWPEHFAVYASHHTTRIAADLDLIAAHVPISRRVLEVGVCPPLLTLALAERGYRVDGVDLDPSRFASAIAEHGLSVSRRDVERDPLPFADGTFDVVVCNEVLEHLRTDPPYAFQEIRRVMAPNGLLVLTTPNMRSVEGLTNLVRHGRNYAMCGDIAEEFGKWRRHGHMGHVREYGLGDVLRFLSHTGFDVERILLRPAERSSKTISRALGVLAPSWLPFACYLARVP
jgi:SAM-dependent methyltransferase